MSEEKKRRQVLLKEAERLAERVVRDYKPDKIILFGSAASGKVTKDSDIDLLVVKDTDERPIKRDQTVLRLLNPIRGRIPVDVLVFTPGEMAWRSQAEDPFVLDVLRGGIVLHE